MEKWGWAGDAGSARSSLPSGRSDTMRRDGKQEASGRRTGGLVTRCLGEASRENRVCGRGDRLQKAWTGGAVHAGGHFGRAEQGWVEVLLTWEEGRLAAAEVEHLVAVHDAEIVPLVLPHERLHYQLVGAAVFPCLEACGFLLVPIKSAPGQGRDEDDEVKVPALVLADPECATVLLDGETFQLQPLSHLGVCDASVTKPGRHLVPLAPDPRAAWGEKSLW